MPAVGTEFRFLSRRLLLASAGMVAACSVLPQAKYVQRTLWPLTVRRPQALPPRAHGKVLMVRDLQPAPGLEQQGLQWKLPDGSLHVDFYNQWAVPPAQGITDDLRRWLGDSGLFAAVVGAASGVAPDLTLEGELTTLSADPQAKLSHAAVVLVLTDQHAISSRILMQRTVAAEAPMTADTPAGVAAATLEAVRMMLQDVEIALRNAVGGVGGRRGRA